MPGTSSSVIGVNMRFPPPGSQKKAQADHDRADLVELRWRLEATPASTLRHSHLYGGYRLRDDCIDTQHSQPCACLGRVPIDPVSAPKFGSAGKPILTHQAR